MRILDKEISLEERILILYFSCAFIEIIAEFIFFEPILFFLKPFTLIVMLYLYWNFSTQRNFFFFVTFFFLMIARLFAMRSTEEILVIAMTAYFIHRLLAIYYIYKLIQLKDIIPLLIVSIPFLFFFLYLLSLTNNISDITYYGLIIQNILMSLLAGMTLSHYFMNNEQKDVWLLIYGILSIMQYFIVFIEKFYLIGLSPISLRLLAVMLTTSVNYTFYKFVIETERINDN